MKYHAHVTAARDSAEARARIVEVGADLGGVEAMAPKMRHYAIKLCQVPALAAVRLKEEMLKLGAEAAVSFEAYHGDAETTDVILMGTVEQYGRLARRLAGPAPGLNGLAGELSGLLGRVEQTRFVVPTPRGQLVMGERTLLMGIVNCTPDSFFDGGRYKELEPAVARGLELAQAGAAILDVGGESTRPGALAVSEEEELQRVVPVIERLANETSALISVDTRKAAVAEKALAAGAALINDISALGDPDMAAVTAKTGAGLILMHMKGTPRTMQADPKYDDLFGEIIAYLEDRMLRATAAGVAEDKIIIDPGIGFGKTAAHNLELIRDLWRLRSLGRPILLGPSNKSFIGKVLGVEPNDRAQGTAAALVAGVLAGAHILRIHDVAAMKRFVDMAGAIKRSEEWNKV